MRSGAGGPPRRVARSEPLKEGEGGRDPGREGRGPGRADRGLSEPGKRDTGDGNPERNRDGLWPLGPISLKLVSLINQWTRVVRAEPGEQKGKEPRCPVLWDRKGLGAFRGGGGPGA